MAATRHLLARHPRIAKTKTMESTRYWRTPVSILVLVPRVKTKFTASVAKYHLAIWLVVTTLIVRLNGSTTDVLASRSLRIPSPLGTARTAHVRWRRRALRTQRSVDAHDFMVLHFQVVITFYLFSFLVSPNFNSTFFFFFLSFFLLQLPL